MMISTKGRYALRVMLDLAQNTEDGCISLKCVSDRQSVSMKYLEMIVSLLHKNGLVVSRRGIAGGYRLARNASEITVYEVIHAAEGALTPVSCLDGDTPCERAEGCLTLPMWKKLDTVICEYLSSVTIQDLLDRRVE